MKISSCNNIYPNETTFAIIFGGRDSWTSILGTGGGVKGVGGLQMKIYLNETIHLGWEGGTEAAARF